MNTIMHTVTTTYSRRVPVDDAFTDDNLTYGRKNYMYYPLAPMPFVAEAAHNLRGKYISDSSKRCARR